MPSSLLITGPPASGKSKLAVERFLGASDSLLIVPTATMAEHLQNEFARAGLAVRPNRVKTLAAFLDRAGVPAAAPKPLIHLLIREALEQLHPARFAPIAEQRGFQAALAQLIEDIPGEAVDRDLARVFHHVQSALAARGMALRIARLETAAARDAGALASHIVFDGFFSFSRFELKLIESLAGRTAVTVSLPDWPGLPEVRARLLSMGFAERRFSEIHRRPSKIAFSAPTLTRETEEIARRILEHAARGRAFRDIGIILRAREPYAAALETTLARFGIPGRFYFDEALLANTVIAYLAGIVVALLDGLDHAELLRLIRMPVSGIGATEDGDRFDFELRERLLGAGLPLTEMEGVPPLLESLASLANWRRERAAPQEWARRLKTLRRLLPEPAISDRVPLLEWRTLQSRAAALDAFDEALDQTAAALPQNEMDLAEFWRAAQVAIEVERLRIPDRRRNAVAVIDVVEARQWALPVVFVCGLAERHFPQYHREDPLMNDAVRRRAGLKTSSDLQAEERPLFDFALTRATEEVVLSYARFNDQGEEALPSFFLEGVDVTSCENRARPKPVRPAATATTAPIQDAALLARLGANSKKLSPTSIESFLQCPFQFFARKTLRLRARPAAPRERLDLLLQGGILHRALAGITQAPLLGEAIFNGIFAEEIRKARVPDSYRTEAVRLEMLRHFENFLADRQLALGWTSRVEEEFSFALNPLLTISGRIDRLDIGPANQALVIDYKYSTGNKIRERVAEHEAGNLVQGGLYLLAAERQFGLIPVGMLYCGLRKGVVWGGWHASAAGLDGIGERRTSGGLRELIDAAAAKAMEVYESIASGKIDVHPADSDKCAWCDFRDICRVETAPARRAAGAA
ncbi:MAG: PD-(D/E)XK nuclease family protein [Bryobacteraceae bacterium]